MEKAAAAVAVIKTMLYCADCKVKACYTGAAEFVPTSCPLGEEALIEESRLAYEEETKEFARQAALIESKGYCRWTRVEETIAFCKAMGYQKIGLAFCIGLKKEAEILSRVFKAHSLELISINCKFSGITKEFIGLSEEEKLRPGTREVMCNPVAQAMFLNRAGTEFNVVAGLCVGHDSLFFKHAEAPCTVLLSKDRVLGNNPAAALYCSEGYLKRIYEEAK